MKLICNRGALLEALTVAGSVIASRTTKPVLQCVKLTCEKDKLTISATDLEVAIRYSDNQVQADQTGEALLPAAAFRDIVRESVDDSLTIETSGEHANIKGQDSHFKIFTQPVSDFPPIPEVEGEPHAQISGGHLKRLINQTLFAAAKESTRYAFNGVLFVAKGKKLTLIATDGRRLAMAHGEVSSSGKLPKEGTKSIVPAKALAMVDKLVKDPEDTVGIQFRENQAIFQTPNATLICNLVEGQFPPYEDVVPKDADKTMTASTADFLSAVKRASLLTTDESRGVRMHFTKKGVKLSSRNPESGEAEVNFPCKFEGSDLEIGFNPTFLTDVLRVVDTDDVSFEMVAQNRPGLVRGGPDFLYVIMPVNLQ